MIAIFPRNPPKNVWRRRRHFAELDYILLFIFLQHFSASVTFSLSLPRLSQDISHFLWEASYLIKIKYWSYLAADANYGINATSIILIASTLANQPQWEFAGCVHPASSFVSQQRLQHSSRSCVSALPPDINISSTHIATLLTLRGQSLQLLWICVYYCRQYSASRAVSFTMGMGLVWRGESSRRQAARTPAFLPKDWAPSWGPRWWLRVWWCRWHNFALHVRVPPCSRDAVSMNIFDCTTATLS